LAGQLENEDSFIHSPPFSAKVKNALSYISALSYVVMTKFSINRRDIFMFLHLLFYYLILETIPNSMVDQAEVLKMEMAGLSEKLIGNGSFQLTGQLKVHTFF
jgi:hypothetical protein